MSARTWPAGWWPKAGPTVHGLARRTAALPTPEALVHGSLVTGLKHYLGPFEAYAKGPLPQTPFRESMPRLNIKNFYYAQEDALVEAAARYGFSWSVHRPHTIIGHAIGNVMNMGSTLAVYARSVARPGAPSSSPVHPCNGTG
ncbi:hypothetical protein GCM10023158_04570 [Gluconacetobacter tumulicola]|nr:hypothetical protein [Gluconacetobacter tumulicola]